jgi:Skp family chaperone for outer membrane proteins
MKTRIIILGCIIGALILSLGFGQSTAKSKAREEVATAGNLKIGLVSIRKIFQTCKRNVKYREQTKLEQDKAIADLQQLRDEINAAEAGLKTRKQGTKDYLDLAQELAQKRAALPLKEDYYQQLFADQDQQWTEKLYKDVLDKTTEVAKEKGLNIVFENDEPEFPINRADELMMAIRTHKLLYCDSGIDITDSVMTLIDAVSPDANSIKK